MLPAGACVFRVHGMGANCVRNGILFVGDCPGPGVAGTAPTGFYDWPYCGQNVVPGCPTADPWGPVGLWWYLQPDGANVDLVVCAPECAAGIDSAGACLNLFPPTRSSLPCVSTDPPDMHAERDEPLLESG
jgi:hypothetical protein